MNFASHLKQIRENRMLSASKLSKQSGLSQSFISRIEAGEKQPTLETLRKLARGLGISLGELLGEELLNEPESPVIKRIIGNLRTLPAEQVNALDLFVASLCSAYAAGENALSLQAINLTRSDQEDFFIEILFSANVSAVMEHRIPDGMKRNMESFHLFDDEMKTVPVDILPGSKLMARPRAERVFAVRPRSRLADGRAYKLIISKLLQANNYKYLKENHTIVFTTHEIIDIKPFNQKLCGPYLSLTLDDCNIPSGSDCVPVNTDIILTFSHNVITQVVRNHNRHCFSLKNSKGQPVEIEVMMADPKDSSTKKKEIVIHPKYGLQSKTVYVLTISESLQSGSRKLLGTDRIITFTTGEANTGADEKGGISIA